MFTMDEIDLLDYDRLADTYLGLSLEQQYEFLDSTLETVIIFDALITRTVWVDAFLLERPTKGEFARLYADLCKDETKFFQYCRMKTSTFQYVHSQIRNKIYRQDTPFRDAIQTEEQLFITLRYDSLPSQKVINLIISFSQIFGNWHLLPGIILLVSNWSFYNISDNHWHMFGNLEYIISNSHATTDT